MQYQLEKLNTVADCNTYEAMVNKEKSSLTYKKVTLERSHETYLERSTNIATDMAVSNSELTALDTIIGGLPDGQSKDENIVKKKKLEYHLFLLGEQNNQYGAIALLEKEMEITLIEKQLEEIENLLQLIETRKTALV